MSLSQTGLAESNSFAGCVYPAELRVQPEVVAQIWEDCLCQINTMPVVFLLVRVRQPTGTGCSGLWTRSFVIGLSLSTADSFCTVQDLRTTLKCLAVSSSSRSADPKWHPTL